MENISLLFKILRKKTFNSKIKYYSFTITELKNLENESFESAFPEGYFQRETFHLIKVYLQSC